MMSRHWGDLPVVPDIDSGIAAIEREQMTKMRPMDVEGPRLHQPSSRHHPPSSEPYPADDFALDSVTVHTIKLIQHARKVRTMIHNVQHTLESTKSSEGELPNFPAAPPIPEFTEVEAKHQFQKPVPFLPWSYEGDFARGIGKPPQEIDNLACRRLLRKSVAAILAHSGYETCGESILETMTDLCHEYFLKMTGLLRQAIDSEAMLGRTGFQDCMEQVFHEMGVNSTTDLYDFYQTRILRYHENMVQQSEQLMEEYEKIKNPELHLSDDNKPVKVKEEMFDIQFPILEEHDEGGDSEQLIHIDALGLEIAQEGGSNAPSLNQEEEAATGSGKWHPQQPKSEPPEPKKSGCIDALTKKKLFDKVQSRVTGGMNSMESTTYDQDESQSASEMPSTPQLGSEAGDVAMDGGSVSAADDILTSPPMPHSKSAQPKKKRRR